MELLSFAVICAVVCFTDNTVTRLFKNVAFAASEVAFICFTDETSLFLVNHFALGDARR
jgi:hypothetical protein